MRKENARQAWKTRRASVREHEQSIAQSLEGDPLPMTKREERMLGALFTGVALAFVLFDVIARNL